MLHCVKVGATHRAVSWQETLMNPTLPPRLKTAIKTLLEGQSRKDLAARAQAISEHYRAGHGSAHAVASASDALAYVVARLPATYAVATAVLGRLRDAAPDFVPDSLLDAGAGPGTASCAAQETWPSLRQLTLIDANRHFLALAQSVLPGAQTFARDLLRDALPDAALVVASYVLAEVAAADQARMVAKLHAAAFDVLVLIEPGTPAGFERLRATRVALIEQGAHVLGPCTHANVCPMAAPDWCHFSQRLPRSRDHLLAKDARVPFEDERYAWLAVSRTRRSALDGRARILAPPREAKPGTTLRLCDGHGLSERFVARRDKQAFAPIRRAGWGDVV